MKRTIIAATLSGAVIGGIVAGAVMRLPEAKQPDWEAIRDAKRAQWATENAAAASGRSMAQSAGDPVLVWQPPNWTPKNWQNWSIGVQPGARAVTRTWMMPDENGKMRYYFEPFPVAWRPEDVQP